MLVRKDDPPKVIAAGGASDGGAIAPAVAGASAAITRVNQLQATASPSFDCLKARSDAEHLVCSDGDLASQDVALANLFVQAKEAVTDKAGFRERVRQQWNYRESACHDRECLARWYAAQRAYLSQVAQTGRLD